MSDGCKGMCDRYAVMKLARDWHNLGLKACRSCRYCFEKHYRNCPCCGYQLSMRTVSGSYKDVNWKQAFPVRYID